jgi:hypothetical protein
MPPYWESLSNFAVNVSSPFKCFPVLAVRVALGYLAT